MGESIVVTMGASREADPEGVGVAEASLVGDAVGSGVGDSLGDGNSVGAGDLVSAGTSTVPRIGLRKSSANERGVTINTQSTTRAIIAFFIVDSGVLAMLASVMSMRKIVVFGRVLTE